jgi:ribose-phosphate pyrophosphokinase
MSVKLFCGSSYRDLGERISHHLDIPLGKITLDNFADGEVNIFIGESVRNCECVIIQSTSQCENKSVNDVLMELLIIIDALKRGSASKVVVVMPYFGYSRADRKDYSRAPISAKVVASCLEAQNVNRIISCDLHSGQISGFFSNNCPMDNLYNEVYFVDYIKYHIIPEYGNNIVIVAPDEGAVKSATRVAGKLNLSAATIFKNREKANVVSQMCLMGDVSGKVAILIDDMIDTAGTACKAASILKQNGAKHTFMLATHGLFSGPAIDRITESNFEKIIVTNTVAPNSDTLKCNKIRIIDVSWIIAEAIRRQHDGTSLSELYLNENVLKNNTGINFIN